MAQYAKKQSEERKMLAEDGYTSDYILRLQPKRVWLRADGSVVGLLPVDPHHYSRFRARGWHLAPPDWTPPKPEEDFPPAPPPIVEAGTIVTHFPLPNVIRRGK